jgi:glycosyltransferase involved in cell wall biosynthesis
VLTSNEAFEPILPKELMVEKNNPNALAEKIKWLRDLSENEKIELRHKLRQEVVENHNLDNLAKKIITQFKK